MDVSGQLHAWAALPPRKQPPIISGQETGQSEVGSEDKTQPVPSYNND
jgi:hypothetical protein